MKTYYQLKEELNHLNEKAPSADTVHQLKTGIGRRNHHGHEGASTEHDRYADKHKGTEAGRHHEKASMHHQNAISALNKGNMTSAVKHSKLAVDSAKKATRAGGENSSSEALHFDHDNKARMHATTGLRTADADKKAKKKADRANPRKAAIGKTVSKVKKLFNSREESVQEDNDEYFVPNKKGIMKRMKRDAENVRALKRSNPRKVKSDGMSTFKKGN